MNSTFSTISSSQTGGKSTHHRVVKQGWNDRKNKHTGQNYYKTFKNLICYINATFENKFLKVKGKKYKKKKYMWGNECSRVLEIITEREFHKDWNR